MASADIDRLREAVRRAKAADGLKAVEEYDQAEREAERRDLGFAGYGRGCRLDHYRRAQRHIKHAAARLWDAGPEFADQAKALERFLEALRPFPQ
jgi:hypothetical protein